MPPKPQPQAQQTAIGTFTLPLVYRVFFLFLEPLSALVGAYYAHFQQPTYLALLRAPASPAAAVPTTATSIVLSQLANLYLLFALNEALVLRATSDLRVWKTVLFVLLVADLGHLWSVRALGGWVYAPWECARWNAIDWGNVPFVYVGASMRVAFLANIGIGGARRRAVRPKKS